MSTNCCAQADETTAGAVKEKAARTVQAGQDACPTCGTVGRPVDTLTLKALLAVPLTELKGDHYRFCGEPECPTVYYRLGDDGPRAFREPQLRERVHQKHPVDGDVPVCYCFRHTPDTIREEVLVTGQSTAVRRVTAGIQAGKCACEIRNPQGSCCLGNVRAAVRRIEGELAANARKRPPVTTPVSR